ncbi:hypothetical protein NKJ52_20625 [Mesorhizobium australicum]|uniref:hypothetical protein n=1 Tax=Mesorhizobium australicum TaxID=536018 RepID=UPI003336FE2E
MVEKANTIWADGPGGNPIHPQKSQIRAWGTYLEGLRFGSALLFTFATSTVDSDPGEGAFRLDNATVSGATAAYLDNVDASGADVRGIIDSWDDSANLVRGNLTIRGLAAVPVLLSFNVTGGVTDSGGYRKIIIAYLGGSGALVAGDQYLLTFDRSGDAGGIVPTAGVNGDGVTSNVAAFTAAGALNNLSFVPKPASKYAFAAPLSTATVGGAWLPDPSMTWDQLTDGGKFNLWKGRATGLSTGANIWRLSDRVFVGGAASKFAGNNLGPSDSGTSWLSNAANAPAYLALNAGVLFTNEGGSAANLNSPYGFVSGIKTSNTSSGGIAFGAAVVADLASNSAWAFMAELQREAGAGQVYGLEIAGKNKGNNTTMTPNAQVDGLFGFWAQGGGDNAFGGASVNPSTAVLAVVKGSNTWNSGLVFMKDALTSGEVMAMSSEGVGGAHALNWYNASGMNTFSILGSSNDSINWSINRSNSGLVVSAGGRVSLALVDAASAVNYLSVQPQAAGTGVLLLAQGPGNDSGLLRGKGTGGWKLQDGAAATKVEFNTTGIGFFGTTPVAAKTGWGVPTGTLLRTTFASYAGQTHTASYVQATVQALDDAVKSVSQRFAAFVTDFHQTAGYGLIRT